MDVVVAIPGRCPVFRSPLPPSSRTVRDGDRADGEVNGFYVQSPYDRLASHLRRVSRSVRDSTTSHCGRPKTRSEPKFKEPTSSIRVPEVRRMGPLSKLLIQHSSYFMDSTMDCIIYELFGDSVIVSSGVGPGSY